MMERLVNFYEGSLFVHIYWLYLVPASLMILHDVLQQVWAERHGKRRPRISIVCIVPVANLWALMLIVISWWLWLCERVSEYFYEYLFGEKEQ